MSGEVTFKEAAPEVEALTLGRVEFVGFIGVEAKTRTPSSIVTNPSPEALSLPIYPSKDSVGMLTVP